MRILIVSTEPSLSVTLRKHLGGEAVRAFPFGKDNYFMWQQEGGNSLVLTLGGLGLIRAAALYQRALCQFAIMDPFDLVIHVGTAGGLGGGVQSGDLVLVSETVQHDLDLTPLGMAPYEMARDGEQSASAIARDLFEHVTKMRFPFKVHVGGLASGSQYIRVAESLPAALAPLATGRCICVDMEGAAINQVSTDHCVPSLLMIRVIAEDGTNAPSNYQDFLGRAGRHAAEVIKRLLEEMRG